MRIALTSALLGFCLTACDCGGRVYSPAAQDEAREAGGRASVVSGAGRVEGGGRTMDVQVGAPVAPGAASAGTRRAMPVTP